MITNMSNCKVQSNLALLKGIGVKREKELNNIGIFKIEDLIYTFPKKYKDFSKIFSLKDAPIYTLCCIKANFEKLLVKRLIKNRTIMYYSFCLLSETEQVTASYFTGRFNNLYLKPGKEFLFFGKIHINELGTKEFLVSNIHNVNEIIPGLYPIYKHSKNINSSFLAKLTKQIIFSKENLVSETLPPDILKKYDLCTLNYALKNIHFPENEKALSDSKRRLVFEEILSLQFYLKSTKCEEKKVKINNNGAIVKKELLKKFYSMLPFTLTNAQQRVINECLKDITNGSAMGRLLQGDVGSGKTIVAAALCFYIVKSINAQVALMAPTEILARQHFNYLNELFKSRNITVELLCSSVPLKKRNLILDNLKNNKISILVGTQSLLNESLTFNNLNLVITDEQHRFGVSQRAKLVNKGNNVHVLVVSATPIPRSLALVLYADLDVSVLDEMPKGRQKVDTYIIDSSKRTRALNFIKKQVESGRQGYIVCPLIEDLEPPNDENENSNNNRKKLESVMKYKENLKGTLFSNLNVKILHGKMKPEEKKQIMQDFINKKIDVLISTTVIEVGIDAPNANVILIENAENLGLAQLHQLRGRVGRGCFKSYCILVTDSKSKETLNRLNTIKQHTDGFKIAEKDLEQRGPGNLLGYEQHGFLKLKTKDYFLSDIKILSKAKQFAKEVLSKEDAKEQFRCVFSNFKTNLNEIGQNSI